MERPFAVRYNPYTQSVEVLDRKESLMNLVHSVKGERVYWSEVKQEV